METETRAMAVPQLHQHLKQSLGKVGSLLRTDLLRGRSRQHWRLPAQHLRPPGRSPHGSGKE